MPGLRRPTGPSWPSRRRPPPPPASRRRTEDSAAPGVLERGRPGGAGRRSSHRGRSGLRKRARPGALPERSGRGRQPTPARSRDVAARYPADYVATGARPAPGGRPASAPADPAPRRQRGRGPAGAGQQLRRVRPRRARHLARPPRRRGRAGRPRLGRASPAGGRAEWAGRPPVRATMAEIGQRLEQLGPGSSAVVGCDRKGGGGHWFNAVNDAGRALAVDGQRNRVGPWPPGGPRSAL